MAGEHLAHHVDLVAHQPVHVALHQRDVLLALLARAVHLALLGVRAHRVVVIAQRFFEGRSEVAQKEVRPVAHVRGPDDHLSVLNVKHLAEGHRRVEQALGVVARECEDVLAGVRGVADGVPLLFVRR